MMSDVELVKVTLYVSVCRILVQCETPYDVADHECGSSIVGCDNETAFKCRARH